MSRSTNACLETISAAVGHALSSQEIMDIASEVEQRITDRVNAGDSRFAAAAAAGKKLAGEELLAAIVERRAAAINVRIRAGLDARGAAGQEMNAIRSVLSGARGIFSGAAASIDAMSHALRDRMHGGLILDFRRAGILKALLWRDKAFERDVAVELWAVRDPTSARATNNAHAVSAAQIINKYMETVRGWQNEAGAWIGKLENYIVRQSHDMWKIRGDGTGAAFDAWRSFIEPRLDASTFEGRADRTAFLRNVWDSLASGLHETSGGDALAGFSGPGNLAKRVSQERLLHFKSADAWFDYNEKFGKGGVVDAALHAIEKGTRDVALMRQLGTNPEAMMQGWIDRMQKSARLRNDFTTRDSLTGSMPKNVLAVLTGEASIPRNYTLAKIGSTVRTMQSLAKLGGVVLSSIPDLAINALMLRHNGIPLFEAYARQMHGLLPAGEARQEVAEALGVGLDHMLGTVMHRFQAEDGAIGKLSAAARQFYNLSGLTYWTDSLKTSAGLMLSNNLARRSATAFDALPARMRASLIRYGIEADDWTKLAAEVRQAADGNHYIIPAEMADRGLSDRVQAYISDQVREGMTEASAADRAITTWGTQRGTRAGEAVRLVMQFKQFAVTYLDRTIGREVLRYGENAGSGTQTWGQLARGVDVGGIAHLIVATTALGYLSMTLKELAKGRMPRDPMSPGAYKEVLLAAMVQGGGLGIYGDFLFGEANRMGGGILATAGGPAMGTLEDFHRVLMSVIHHQGHPVAEGIQTVKNNAPFINLFYSRMVLDHLILFRMQEWANPGYLRRYEQNVKSQNHQTFWLRPSAFVQ